MSIRILWYPKSWKAFIENPNWIFMTSNRMRVYNFHESIKNYDHVDSEVFNITVKNIDPLSFDVIIFQKKAPDNTLAKKLSNSSDKFVVFDICDPASEEFLKNAHEYINLFITSSHELGDQTKEKTKVPVEVVVDAHEANPSWNKSHLSKEKIIVSWYGIGENYIQYVKPIRSYLDLDFVNFQFACGNEYIQQLGEVEGFQEGIEMRMDWRESWGKENSWQRFIFNSDVGVVPVFGAVKPAHKIQNYMAYGIPVICTPTDAHKRIIKHGENGFFASSNEDWSKYIDILRDPEIRNTIGEKARDSVLKQYSIQSKADDYLDTIKRHYISNK